MTHFINLKVILLFFSVICNGKSFAAGEDKKPNIIVILADDMGYSDVGCMGGEIETPNLDALAGNGLLFTHCYNASRCAPSRASLLTGLYQHRTGVGHMVENYGYPAYQGFLNNKCVTIAEVLKEEGYTTIMTGKWHLGDEHQYWPDNRGFENYFGSPKGGGLYFYPSEFVDRPLFRNGKMVTPDPETFYSTDNFTTEAIQFIEQNNETEKPFFLYLAYIAPHFPLQAWPEDIAKYEGRYSVGYETIRKNRFERQKELGIIDTDVKLSPSDYDNWDEETAKEEAHKMAVYAAMVDRMDQNIGKLVDFLKRTGQLDNTLILFLSDNGACSRGFNRSPGAEIGTVNSFAAYGLGWANVGSTPYRKYKRFEHEGGILTPMIAHWPAGIKKNKITHEVVHIIDIMPTCLAVAGAEYPQNFEGNKIHTVDGKSFYSSFRDENPGVFRQLFWEHEGNKAVRSTDWKLVKMHNYPWELYELETDPTELKNLINQKPVIADSLKQLWSKKASEMNVRSWPVKK